MAFSYVVVTFLHYGSEYGAYSVPGDLSQCSVDEEFGEYANKQL